MPDLPTRKPNRLKNFDYSSDGLYFITVCVQDQQCILSKIVGDGALDVPKNILSEYGKIVEKNIISGNKIPNVTVEKYVIMPNHIHMILSVENKFPDSSGTSRAPSTTNKTIPHFVSTLKRFCHGEIGWKIFQRSYHDHIIRNEKEYLKIWEYIENNPLKWEEDCFFNDNKSERNDINGHDNDAENTCGSCRTGQG